MKQNIFSIAGIAFFMTMAGVSQAASPELDLRKSSANPELRTSVFDWLSNQIPQNSPVIATQNLKLRLNSPRSDLKFVKLENNSADYALIDFGDFLKTGGVALETGKNLADEKLDERRDYFMKRWNVKESAGNVVLFSTEGSKGEKNLFKKIDLKDDRPVLVLNARAEEDLNLIGITMEPDADNYDIVRFAFYWQKLRPSQTHYGMFFAILSTRGEIVQIIKKPLCFDLYPFGSWKLGEVVREDYGFVVPTDLVDDTYEVHFGVYDVGANEAKALVSPREDAIDEFGLAKLIALDAV